MNTSPKIQVFCPVDPSQLESTPHGVVCRKCQQELVDVARPSETKKLTNGVCGVMRHLIGPVVGSTIALSGCSLDSASSDSEHLKELENQDEGDSRRSEITLPGIYFHPGGETYDPNAYPVAEHTDKPGIVISPYTQSKVDVSRISEGTLVLDPAFKMADKKFFRVPSTQDKFRFLNRLNKKEVQQAGHGGTE